MTRAMCIAIPARVTAVTGHTAEVERYGERLEVSLALMCEPVAVGDYLILQAQRFAVDKIAPEAAAEAYRLFEEAFGLPPAAAA